MYARNASAAWSANGLLATRLGREALPTSRTFRAAIRLLRERVAGLAGISLREPAAVSEGGCGGRTGPSAL